MLDTAGWFEDDEFVPEFTWCNDCGERLPFRDAAQVVEGVALGGAPYTVLVCYECADKRTKA